MTGARSIRSSCCMVLLNIISIILLTKARFAGSSTVGVCYGRVADNLPSPAEVVSLLKANNVDRVRIFDTNSDVLAAFQGSGITLIVGAENPELQQLSSSAAAAAAWVQAHISPYASVIRYISVGNEVLASQESYAPYLYGAMQNVWAALQAAGLSESVKVSTAHAAAVVQGYPPSAGKFASTVEPTMSQILSFLSSTGAPLFINVYPYFSYVGNPAQIALGYAVFLPEAGGSITDSGNGLTYTGLFEAQVDTFIAAVAAAGYSDVDVHVTETGWPSAGDVSGAASVANARTYNGNLVGRVPSGTPRRPNRFLQTYLFALFNENLKEPPGVEQNFGVFFPNQTMVYPLSF